MGILCWIFWISSILWWVCKFILKNLFGVSLDFLVNDFFGFFVHRRLKRKKKKVNNVGMMHLGKKKLCFKVGGSA